MRLFTYRRSQRKSKEKQKVAVVILPSATRIRTFHLHLSRAVYVKEMCKKCDARAAHVQSCCFVHKTVIVLIA